jgi:hypothetical protein
MRSTTRLAAARRFSLFMAVSLLVVVIDTMGAQHGPVERFVAYCAGTAGSLAR